MEPPPLPGPTMLRQRWLDVAFLHWQVDPDDVAPHLPDGVVPDVLDGVTYVGLVPFRLAGMGAAVGPALLRTFAEINVRVYGIDDQGRPGVVFLSVDVTSAAMAFGGRAAGLPYRWVGGDHRTDGGTHRYRFVRSRRGAGGEPLRSRVDLTPGPEREPGPLEEFLTSRWALHNRRLGRTWYLRNTHETWPLHDAELLDLHDDLVPAAGFPALRGRSPDHVMFSRGVTARFGFPSFV